MTAISDATFDVLKDLMEHISRPSVTRLRPRHKGRPKLPPQLEAAVPARGKRQGGRPLHVEKLALHRRAWRAEPREQDLTARPATADGAPAHMRRKMEGQTSTEAADTADGGDGGSSNQPGQPEHMIKDAYSSCDDESTQGNVSYGKASIMMDLHTSTGRSRGVCQGQARTDYSGGGTPRRVWGADGLSARGIGEVDMTLCSWG
ncbi:hypothetical protein BKA81DRAFT_377311 [Phyllosticta paracitricarpa]